MSSEDFSDLGGEKVHEDFSDLGGERIEATSKKETKEKKYAPAPASRFTGATLPSAAREYPEVAEAGNKFATGFGKGAANLGINAMKIAGHPHERYALEPGEEFGGVMGEMAPAFLPFGGAVKAMGYGASKIPMIGEALAQAANSLNKIPSITKLTNLLKSPALKTATATGAYGAVENPENPLKGAAIGAAEGGTLHGLGKILGIKNPFARAAVLAPVGGAVGYELGGKSPYESGVAGATVGGALPFLMGGSKRIALQNALKEVNPEAIARKAEAKNVLGVDITPAEATRSKEMAIRESKAGFSNEGKQRLNEFRETREIQEPKAIHEALRDLSPKEHYADIEEPLYKEATKVKIPQKDLLKIITNKDLSGYIKEMGRDKIFGKSARNADANSVEYFDILKRFMDDQREMALKSGKNGKHAAKIIKDDIEQLTSVLDEASPKYKQARYIASKRLTRESMERAIKESEYGGGSFYDKVINNPKVFGGVKNTLSLIGGKEGEQLRRKFDVMKNVYKDLLESPGAKEAYRAGQEGKALPKVTKASHPILHSIYNLARGKYDKEFTRIITNPEWEKDWEKLEATKDRIKRSKLLSALLAKATSVGAQEKTSPLNLELTEYAGTTPRGEE